MIVISESVPASVEVFHFDVFFHRFFGVENNGRMGKIPIPRENSRVFYGFPCLRFLWVPPFDVHAFGYPIIM